MTDIISASELAKRWGYNTASPIYHLIRKTNDPLPAYRMGEQSLRIDYKEAEAWRKRQLIHN